MVRNQASAPSSALCGLSRCPHTLSLHTYAFLGKAPKNVADLFFPFAGAEISLGMTIVVLLSLCSPHGAQRWRERRTVARGLGDMGGELTPCFHPEVLISELLWVDLKPCMGRKYYVLLCVINFQSP